MIIPVSYNYPGEPTQRPAVDLYLTAWLQPWPGRNIQTGGQYRLDRGDFRAINFREFISKTHDSTHAGNILDLQPLRWVKLTEYVPRKQGKINGFHPVRPLFAGPVERQNGFKTVVSEMAGYGVFQKTFGLDRVPRPVRSGDGRGVPRWYQWKSYFGSVLQVTSKNNEKFNLTRHEMMSRRDSSRGSN